MFLSDSVPRHSSDGLEPIPRSVALATTVALSPIQTHTHIHFMHMCMYVQWNLSNRDTNGVEEGVIVSEVSSFQCMQEWYLGWEKVPYLERCPQFRSVLIERERGSTVYNYITVPTYVHVRLCVIFRFVSPSYVFCVLSIL